MTPPHPTRYPHQWVQPHAILTTNLRPQIAPSSISITAIHSHSGRSLGPDATQLCNADAAILQDGAAPRRKAVSADTPEIDPSAPSRASGPLSRSTDFQFFAALLSPVLERLEGSGSVGSEVASGGGDTAARSTGKRQKRLAARSEAVAVAAAATPPLHDSAFWNTCSRCDAHTTCLYPALRQLLLQ